MSLRVLDAARNELLFAHRYLERALFRLRPEPDDAVPFGTDGRKLRFSPQKLLHAYASVPSSVTRACLHSVLHCLYLHPYYAVGKDRLIWNLAADLSAADIAVSLNSPIAEDKEEEQEKRRILAELSLAVPLMSAQNLYAYLRGGNGVGSYSLGELSRLFMVDSHQLWRGGGDARDNRNASGHSGGEADRAAGTPFPSPGNASGHSEGEADADSSGAAPDRQPERPAGTEKELWQDWKDAAEAFSVALSDAAARQEKYGSRAGQNPNHILKTLENLTRKNYDYRWFLRRFAHPEEQMRLNPDEFDIIFYTYGLELYGNLPLIEPLEYREAWVVRNFVIAIDTSASCDGILVRRFLERTVSILSETAGFSEKINIHLLQCDSVIQEDLHITDLAQLENLVSRFTLRGFGGTDFRPVFAYVEELRRQKKIPLPDGLVYFTDGLGEFPLKAPPYRTAFVFVERDDNVRVPPWAMRVYLDADTLS